MASAVRLYPFIPLGLDSIPSATDAIHSYGMIPYNAPH